MKNISDLSYVEALEQVSDLVLNTDALVVDMCDAPGYPSLMVLVKDCMPLFLFVKPDRNLDDNLWQAAKAVVERKLASVNATWFDLSAFEDMDWLLGEILKRTKPGEIKRPAVQVTAEQSGFEFDPPVASEPVAGSVVAGKPEKASHDRKKWLE